MRFLALQTNVGTLKKQFIPEGENEIMTVTRHPIRFFIDLLLYSVVAAASAIALSAGVLLWEGSVGAVMFAALLVLVGIVWFFLVSKSYVAYRYNFLIITTEKIVLIRHTSFVSQKIDSIPLTSIQMSNFRTQFFGLVHCGILRIHLSEVMDGSTRRIVVPYVPHPDTVASAIENAIALRKQMKQGTEGREMQELKAQVIKEDLIEQAGGGVVVQPPAA